MSVITKTNNHERESAALAWLSEAFKKGWRIRYEGKYANMYELSLNWCDKKLKNRVTCHQSDTLLEVIEKAKAKDNVNEL